jgi:hypothetical protein
MASDRIAVRSVNHPTARWVLGQGGERVRDVADERVIDVWDEIVSDERSLHRQLGQ